MPSNKNRKMGFAEKVSTIFHDEMLGACSVSSVIKVKGEVGFNLFKQAWNIAFLKHPLLRATCLKRNKDYFFNCNASFHNIPIKLITAKNMDSWEQEYSEDILKPFELNKYFWRSTLVKTLNSPYCHIIFSTTHSISDGKSITWLLGELISTIAHLHKGIFIDPICMPLPPALDEIIDLSKFCPTPIRHIPSEFPWQFERQYNPKTHKNKNLFKVILPENLNQLLKKCKHQGVTFTHALTSALALSLFELKEKKQGSFDFCLAVDFRPYTNPPTSNEPLAFYAQPVMITLEIQDDYQDFWELTRQTKEKLKFAIKNYRMDSADKHELIDNLIISWKVAINNQQPFFPNCISNLGRVDEAFNKIAPYGIEEYYFTVNQQNTPHGLAIFCSTFNDTCYFDFNFSSPAMSTKWIELLIEKTFAHLLNSEQKISF